MSEIPITELERSDAKSSISLLGRHGTKEQAWKLITTEKVSAVGLLEFSGSSSAREAARQMVALGSIAEMSFYYIGDKDSRKARDQFREEISKDFSDIMQTAELDGHPEVAERLEALLPHIQDISSRFMDLYDTSYEFFGKTEMCFMLKIEINIPGACVKLHNDSVGVRFVTSLVGGGTVVADGEALDWPAWKACEGLLPMSSMSEEDMLPAIVKFNSKLCPAAKQLQFRDFDLLMIKGDTTGDRPCIHRAPLSAGRDDVRRILMKLDFIPRAHSDKYIELADASDYE